MHGWIRLRRFDSRDLPGCSPVRPARLGLYAVGPALLAVGLAVLALGPVSVAGAVLHRTAAASPRITIASPKPDVYAAGHKLVVKFSCTAAAGVATCTATLSGAGTRARSVVSGTAVKPAKTGKYTLRITARDRRRRSTTTAVEFLVERAVSWSGFTWFVRHPGWGGPGPNHWSDSSANVHVSGGDLVLSVVKDSSGVWTSAEVDNQRHLGYGTYRWVITSDLSGVDPYQVIGMFTSGGAGPSVDEIDIEPSRCGNPLSPDGSAAVWQNVLTRTNESATFAYSGSPPYISQFTWSPGRVTFVVTDGTGAVLLDWTVTSGVPKPTTEVPIINFWRFHDTPPATVSTVRIASFSWTPLGHQLT